MTQQEKIDSHLTINRLYDRHGYELVEMIGLKLLTESNNYELQGNTIVAGALKTAGKRLQAECSSLITCQMIYEIANSQQQL